MTKLEESEGGKSVELVIYQLRKGKLQSLTPRLTQGHGTGSTKNFIQSKSCRPNFAL